MTNQVVKKVEKETGEIQEELLDEPP
jgi:hypothetical protein